jgi:hypothetical protein
VAAIDFGGAAVRDLHDGAKFILTQEFGEDNSAHDVGLHVRDVGRMERPS